MKLRVYKSEEARSSFRAMCEMASSGEPVLIVRPLSRNVVLISESEYTRLKKQENHMKQERKNKDE